MQHVLGGRLVRAVDVYFRFNDGYEACSNDLTADLKLLGHHGLDASRVGFLDHGAHLGTENTGRFRFRQQRIKIGYWLHDLRAIDDISEALVDFQERYYLLHIPEVAGCRLAFHLPIHGVFEQDRAEDAIAAKRRARHDARTHRVHDIEHLLVVRPGVRGYAVKPQCLGCTAATLVECGDKSWCVFDLLELFCVAHDSL